MLDDRYSNRQRGNRTGGVGRIFRAARATGDRRRTAFTLIEILVSVAIIALLISILLPSLARAREQARGSVCLSNLKQVGTGLTLYLADSKGRYPMHSSLKSQTTALGRPRTRWPDSLNRLMRSEAVYDCPDLSDTQRLDFSKPWAHNPDRTYGGYGYNFQYLGNARHWPDGSAGSGTPRDWARPFHAQAGRIRHPAATLAVADTRGSRKGDPDRRFGEGGAGVYVIDPPLGSYDLGSKGSRKNKGDRDRRNLWYEGGTDASEEELVRSGPDARHNRRVSTTFCDGHAERMNPARLDGRADGGPGDNRYYNGLMAPMRR